MSRFRKPVQILRFAEGAYVDGRWVPGSPTEFCITASVQPTRPEDLQSLPEGRRVLASYRLYTNDVLFVPREGSNGQPDRAVIKDEEFEIMALADWDNGIRTHRRYLAVRMDPNG